MDPLSGLSLAAAVVQFVELGTKVASRINEFRKSTGEVPESLRSVSDQLPLLVQSLKRTQEHRPHDKDEEISLKPVVEGCYAQVQSLQQILDKTLPSKDESAWRRGRKALSSLNKDGDRQRINSKLAEYIRTLTYFHTTAIPDISNLQIQPADQDQERGRKKPAFLVKFDQDPHFIGRDDILQTIFTRFESGHHRIAIHGMAGVGKSKIAIETCHRFRDRHLDAHVFWIHAGSLVRFEQSYKEIAEAMNLVTQSNPNVNILVLVRDWLNETTTPWLAIFDNADDMNTLFPSMSSTDQTDPQLPRLSDYFPRANVGSVIVTTRDRRVAVMLTNAVTAAIFQLNEFELPLAQAFLQSRLGSDSSKDAQQELVQALDCLPLAISQAAAFILQNAISPTDYLELLHSSDAEMKELLATETHDLSRDPEIRNSIIQTWMLSFARIQEQNPTAAHILSLMAVFDRQSVPSFFLRKEGDSKIQFMTAMGTLKAFSLVAEESDSSTYSMHRVVYLATQSWLKTRGTLGAVRREAIEAVGKEIDIDLIRYDWTPRDNFLPHARLIAMFGRAEETSSNRAKLLSGLASYDTMLGDLQSARTAAVEAIEIYRSIGESQSIAFLGSGRVLFDILLDRQEYQECEALSSELLSICTKIGRTSYMIACRHAHSITCQERYKEAEQLLRQVLDRATNVDDCDIGERITIYQALASAFTGNSKYSEAEEIVTQGLELLRDSHPESVALERTGLQQALAYIYRRQARWQEAVDVYQECLHFWEGYRGQASRDALDCRSSLGFSLLNTSNFDEAATTAYIGFDLAVRNLGISDSLSSLFAMNMILASLGQDNVEGIPMKRESTQEVQNMIGSWDDMIEEKVRPFLVEAFARDRSLEQAESHLRKAFRTCRVKLGLGQERTPHLDKAYNDIWDVIQKYKIAQGS